MKHRFTNSLFSRLPHQMLFYHFGVHRNIFFLCGSHFALMDWNSVCHYQKFISIIRPPDCVDHSTLVRGRPARAAGWGICQTGKTGQQDRPHKQVSSRAQRDTDAPRRGVDDDDLPTAYCCAKHAALVPSWAPPTYNVATGGNSRDCLQLQPFLPYGRRSTSSPCYVRRRV